MARRRPSLPAPKSGAGLGLRASIKTQVLANHESIDFVEVVLDDYIHLNARHSKRQLRDISSVLPLLAHGIGLSLGSAQGLDIEYVEDVARFLDALGIEFYSEHLSFRRGGDFISGQFIPMPFNEEAVEVIAKNSRTLRSILGRPLIFENVTYQLAHPFGGMGEPAFLQAVFEECDATWLFDITNLLINAANFDFSPTEWLNSAPTHKITQVHLAGGHTDQKFHVDSHSHPIPDPAYAILSDLVTKKIFPRVIIERDKDFPPIEELLAEISHVQRILGNEKISCNRFLDAPPYIQTCKDNDTKAAKSQPPSDILQYQKDMVEYIHLPKGKLRVHRTSPFIESIPLDRILSFKKVLSTKRREKLERFLPRTWNALESQNTSSTRKEVVSAWFEHEPQERIYDVDESLDFLLFVSTSLLVDIPIQEMAKHEAALLRLQKTPYRRFRPLARLKLTLLCDPQEVDAWVSGALPPIVETPKYCTYTRFKHGIRIFSVTAPLNKN